VYREIKASQLPFGRRKTCSSSVSTASAGAGRSAAAS